MNERDFNMLVEQTAKEIMDYCDNQEDALDNSRMDTDCTFPYYSDCHEICRQVDTSLAEQFMDDCSVAGKGYDDYAFKLANIEFSERVYQYIQNYWEDEDDQD